MDSDNADFLSFLPEDFDRVQQEMLEMFEFTDRLDSGMSATSAPSLASVTFVADADTAKQVIKTRKPRVKKGSSDVVHVKQRYQSVRSIKFDSIAEEVQYRLYSVCTKKTSLIDNLVRACYHECGRAWVTWRQFKDIAARVGYKSSSQMFKSVWVLTHCLYGSDSRNCTWLPALTFPYWELDTSRYDAEVAIKGCKGVVKDELYMLRLSEHFFTSSGFANV